MATLLAKIGLIDRATIVEGHITGFLDSVEVNANKITAGTLVADRILLKGSEKGLLYALNNLGELTSTTVDSLDGYVLTDRTINADKIVASSITANELDVANIFANNAVISTITSQQAFINAISTNSVVVGAKKTADEIKENIYSPNTTTIDGGKITTNSIKAKQIDVANLFAQDITATGTITGATLKGAKAEINSGSIGGFALTEKLTATGTAYLPPALSDFNTIKNAMANDTIGSLYSQNVWWDINGDGKTDVYDFGYMRNMILGKSEYKDYAHKKLSNVTIEISPNSTDKSIRIYGTNAWGSLIETYIGIDEVATNSIKANSYISVGGDTWNADGISSTGDIIAGLGTSNQVSLIGLKGLKDDLMGNGSAYMNGWEPGSKSLKANTNTIMYAFNILKSGIYMFIPYFRFVGLPSGRAVSVRLFEYTDLQYPVKNYPDCITLIGAGVDFISMNGIQIFEAKANKKYYVMGYSAGGSADTDTLDWFQVRCIKTT